MARVAIVTGGASGMGLATVDRLRRRGDVVVSFDVHQESPVDVSDGDAVASAVEEVRRRHGPVDILVNAAGVGAGGPIDAPGYLDEWEKALSVNLTGAMLMVRACLPDLVASGTGRVVNVASTEAISAQRGTGPYTVSKHGLLGLSRSLAVDYGRTGLTVNCVCPGATDTPLVADIPDADKAVFARRHIPLGRYGTADEIAYVIEVLTDVQASFVNGAAIVVDGGMTAKGC